MNQQLQLNDLLAIIKQNPQLADLLTTHYLKQQPMMLAAGDGVTSQTKDGFQKSGLDIKGGYGTTPGMMTPKQPAYTTDHLSEEIKKKIALQKAIDDKKKADGAAASQPKSTPMTAGEQIDQGFGSVGKVWDYWTKPPAPKQGSR